MKCYIYVKNFYLSFLIEMRRWRRKPTFIHTLCIVVISYFCSKEKLLYLFFKIIGTWQKLAHKVRILNFLLKLVDLESTQRPKPQSQKVVKTTKRLTKAKVDKFPASLSRQANVQSEDCAEPLRFSADVRVFYYS